MHQYTEFEGAPLPVYGHQQDHDPMPVASSLIDSIGTTFDAWGSTRRKGHKQTIALSGLFVGDTEYITDESGVILTDESGEYLTMGSPQEYLHGQVTALTERVGVRGSLWRTRLADEVRQWKTARLLAVPWARSVEDKQIIAHVACQFETSMIGWRAEDPIERAFSTIGGTTQYTTMDNGGSLTVDDAVITITRTSNTITQVDILGVLTGIALRWEGSLGSGDVLTIDCGALTVTKNDEDAYSGFSLQPAHTVNSWLPLRPGSTPLTILTTGGASDVGITYYEQFA